jgi:hypothetical protein
MVMAKSKDGAAYAWSDGRNHKFDAVGDGIAGVGRGGAFAMSGNDNLGVAYSTKAAKNSKTLESRGGMKMIGSAKRCCGGKNMCDCRPSKCKCTCDGCVCGVDYSRYN